MGSHCQNVTSTVDMDFIDQTIAAAEGTPGFLLGVLERVQERDPQKHLSRETLKYIARATNLPLSRLSSIVTFYTFFNLEPQGRNTVCVCRGTACHVRGSRGLLDVVTDSLNIARGRTLPATTADGEITVRTVACFGQCALAPIVEVNREVFGHMDADKMRGKVKALTAPKMEAAQ